MPPSLGKLLPRIRRSLPPLRPFSSAPPSFLSLIPLVSLNSEPSVADDVLHLLSIHPSRLEPSLDVLLPLFTPHLVSSVLDSSPPPSTISAFRFFNWASRRSHLRTWHSHALMVKLLRSDPSGFDSAWECLELMRSDDVVVCPHAFEALIYAYGQSGMVGKAVEAYERMGEFGCNPNVFVYNAVISALVRKGFFLVAMGLYNRMRKSDCDPNRSTFSILIMANCREGRNADALHLFDEMSRRGLRPDTVVYNLVIHGLCRAGRMEDAMGLYLEMGRKGVHQCAVTCETLLDGFCRAGKVDLAFRVLEDFVEDGLVLGLHGYASLINGLFRCRRFKDACIFFNTIVRENVQPDCIMYTSMIKGFADNGCVEEAFAFLGEMIKRGIEPDTFCYNTLTKGLCDVGHLDEAFALLSQISSDPVYVDSETYNIIICGLCNKGLVAEAQHIFEEMGKKGYFPTVVTFNALISCLCKFKKVKEAHSMFVKMEMPRKPFMFLPYAHLVSDSHSLREHVERLCEAGQALQAYNLLQLLAENGAVQPDIYTYTILIHNLCKDKKFDEALHLFKDSQVRGLVPDAVTYGTLISGFQSQNRFKEALTFIDEMFKSGCTPSLPLYYIIMKALCKMKKVTCAIDLWLSYISNSDELSNMESDYLALVKKHFEVRSIKEMLRCLIEMDIKGHTHYSSPHGIWLHGFCEAEKLDEAYQIFVVLRAYKIEISPSTCLTLFRALCTNRMLCEATDVFLYTMKGAYEIGSHHGNFLLQRLFDEGKKGAVAGVAAQMGKFGYNLDADLERKTKVLMYESSIT